MSEEKKLLSSKMIVFNVKITFFITIRSNVSNECARLFPSFKMPVKITEKQLPEEQLVEARKIIIISVKWQRRRRRRKKAIINIKMNISNNKLKTNRIINLETFNHQRMYVAGFF